MERLKQQIEFILEVDKIKNIFRQTPISDNSRRENDSEHSWHLAMMAFLLSEYSNEEIDVKKLLTFEESSIDLMLPSTLIRFESDCYIVNGNFPKRVLSIITNQGNFDAFPYTYIKGDKKWKK